LIGGICPVHASTIEPSPPKLRLHSEYLGGTIKKKRTEKGLTQAQLAEKSGLQQSHISRLEAGRYSPSWKTLGKIAEALGIEIGDLDPSN
jgi:transcriptional regulator with XRE-family HTH domain